VRETATGVPCVYCGARHSRAAEVRACWAGSLQVDVSSVPTPTPAEAGPHVGSMGPVLGRSVVVVPGQAPPVAWEQCERAGGGIEELEQAWRERVPLVIETADDFDDEPAEVERAAVWSLSPSFAFPGERLAHATFANAIDARRGSNLWPLAQQAVRLGATAGGPADVMLLGGTPALCDGGPLEWRGAVGGAVVVPRMALLAGSLTPFGPNDTDVPLALDQLGAVLHVGGAARIIAPAGSGKTRVLTERARHLLRRWRLPGRAVTLVAFNKRAADQMKERTPDLPELQVRTLNALGLSLLTKSSHVTTIEEREVRSILDTLVDLPRRANADPSVAWIEAFSAVRLGLQAPAAVEAEFGGDVDGLPEVFERYRRLLVERRLVDFDEHVYRAIEVLLTDPAARRSARASCRMLLVDEFQDLTPAHLLFIRLLAGPEGSVFGVGDDDQTIYGYSGASPEWLIDFRRYFPTAREHALEVNYRCPVPVVEAAGTLLTHNRRRVEKHIVAAPGRVPSAGELEVIADDDALVTTVEVVASLLARGMAPNDVAVLTRVNASLAPVQVALVHRAIPVRPAVDPSYLTRGGVQAALAWLRLAVSSPERLAGSDVALAVRRPSRALSPKVVEWMSEQLGIAGLERLAGRLQVRDGEKVLGFVSDLQQVRRSASTGVTAAVLRAVRDDVGLDRAMELLEGSRRRLDRSAQTDDLDALVALAVLHPDPEGFEEWLRQSLRHPGSDDGVMLSTIHRVKGREWPHVVLHEVSAGLLPHRLAVDVEEERRVFHVGLTRGSSSVHVVAGAAPSPFLAELNEEWTPNRPQLPEPRSGLRPAPRLESSRQSRPQGAKPGQLAKAEPEVRAEIGLEFEHGGHLHRVMEIDDDGVIAVVGRSRLRVPFGELVTVAGRLSHLVAEPPSPEVVERVRQALRTWRSERAVAERKPPFVFLHDRTLDALASCVPTSMAALAKVKGIGPSKLDSYGDELLALIEAARRAG
jgi:DNA helicase II / ATP-dependent DNA helicase PcrA